MKSCKVYAPATVSNVGPGFDLMGFAIEKPGDILRIQKNSSGVLKIFNETKISLPADPGKNVSTVAIQALLDDMGSKQGFDIIFEQKIHPGSGIGSSAASCTAAVKAVNELLGKVYSDQELIPFALEGEFIASGSLHADNVAPAMLGGVLLIRQYNPIDIISLNLPDNLWCTIIHPQIEIKTAESRKLIPHSLPLKDCLSQAGNLASLVAGITNNDFEIIKRSLNDYIAEPVRKHSIPGYDKLKSEICLSGNSCMNISGSGPSLFALSDNEVTAKLNAELLKNHFSNLGIPSNSYFSKISQSGTRIIQE